MLQVQALLTCGTEGGECGEGSLSCSSAHISATPWHSPSTGPLRGHLPLAAVTSSNFTFCNSKSSALHHEYRFGLRQVIKVSMHDMRRGV